MYGGSKETLGDTLPGIVSPEAMHEHIEFYYVSAHGRTNLSEYYVVPENTFVFYLGFSGFVKISGREDNPDLDRMLFPGGYESVVFEESNNSNSNENNNGVNRNAERIKEQSAYWDELYKNFITGKQRSYRLYPKASIYVPGDIVPQTILSFNSDFSDFWRKGVFTLPIRQDLLDTFTREERKETMTQFMLIDNKGDVPVEYFTKAVFKPGKEAEWQTLKVDDKAELTNEQEKPEYWFENPSAFDDFVNEYLRHDPDNLVETHAVPLDKNRTPISNVLNMIPNTKQYRFFIVTSCRTPYNVDQGDKIYFKTLADRTKYMYPNPANLPRNLKPQYRIARRASFSAKQTEEDVCSHTQEPAMNLLRVNAIVHEVLDTQIVEKYLADHEDVQLRRLVDAIRAIMDVRVIPIRHLARLLDVTTTQYTIMDVFEPELKPLQDILVRLLSALQVAFGFFIYGLHQDKSIQAENALKTAGEWLMEHSFKKQQAPLYTNSIQRNAMLANQRTFVNRNTYAQFEAANMRYRIEPSAEEIEFVSTVEQTQNAFLKRLNTLQPSAQGANTELAAIHHEYNTVVKEHIARIESIQAKYVDSYKVSAKNLVYQTKNIIKGDQQFSVKYAKAVTVIDSKHGKHGGKRTRKQKRIRRNTRKHH